MRAQVIVLNGGSSSGKTSLARCLQEMLLPQVWLAIGVDTLIAVAPAGLWGHPDGIVVAEDGSITVGAGSRAAEAAWLHGVAQMIRKGARVILDEVFLDGAAGQAVWRDLLDGVVVCWVGVRCAAEVAVAREAARGDRAAGMAATQAESVHRGVVYDLEVDAGRWATEECARQILAEG